jgi:hypothetical protein
MREGAREIAIQIGAGSEPEKLTLQFVWCGSSAVSLGIASHII